MTEFTYCIFCGHKLESEMADIPDSGTFQGVGYANCKNEKCKASIKFFVEDWPKSAAAVSAADKKKPRHDSNQKRLDQS
jgi:hypothetical protein